MEKKLCELTGFGTGYPEALTGELYFSWKYGEPDGYQKEYRLLLWEEERLQWDTGWIVSEQSEAVKYQGSPLKEDCDYSAQVMIRTNTGRLTESDRISFSTGISDENWISEWLKPYQPEASAPMFRREFFLEKPLKRARLYVCGLGYCEAYLNGEKAGQDLLGPAWTDYRKRVCYTVYDVKKLLKQGENVIGILLGRGWYGSMINHALDGILFSAQLSVTYEDGQKVWFSIEKNSGWKVYSGGPIKENSIYIGEVYDARDEADGWNDTGFDASYENGWKTAIVTEPPEGIVVPKDVEPIEKICRISPAAVTEPEAGCFVIDFGQNIAGLIEIEIEEPEGTEITIRYAELLDDKGMLNTANLRTAQAKDVYISAGKKAHYCPRFTYHGFRYAEIRGISKKESISGLKAAVVRNAVDKRGHFECHSDLVNKIQDMCVWTESNNLHWVPTDCPQRDERLGWLNDLTVRAEEAVYNFELHRFYTKFLQDIADAQGKRTGAITDTVPYTRYGSQPADPVCSSFLILGWLMYQHYGDRDTLEKYYGCFSAWTQYLYSVSEDGIVPYSYYGDWASPISGSIEGSYGSGAVSGITPGTLMSTGFLYYNAGLMRQMAIILEKQEDLPLWEKIAGDTKKALNEKFYHSQTGDYASGSQAANTFMVWLGIAPDKEKTVKRIVKDVKEHKIHLTTGNICSRYILEVLTENGYVDLAYALVTQTTYPSWGYMVEKGATTTWERWEFVESGPLLGMASHDHPMYSTVSAWFYRYLLGIQVEEAGFRTFRVHPYFPKKLPWVKGELNTVKGKIEVAWEKSEQEAVVSVTVPFHTQCYYIIADGPCTVNGKAEKPMDGKLILKPGRYKIVHPIL
ncbi:MAG: family 78 glycoside hydrolase catalytic domain [Eubacteriales bacterium]|nr:family 78 glycoside hydrolase catalytic domain [Eubacteriales bacterium]